MLVVLIVCVWHFGMNHMQGLGNIFKKKKKEDKMMCQTKELNEVTMLNAIRSKVLAIWSYIILQPQAVRLYQKLFIKEIQFDYLCSW